MRTGLMLGLLVVVALTPVATAQEPVDRCSQQCAPTDPDVNDPAVPTPPVSVVMYGHFEDVLDRAPLNLVPPHPTEEPDLARGFLMPVLDTNTDVCPTGSTCADVHFRNGQFQMFFCPGTIEYLEGGWRRNCHSPTAATPLEVLGPVVVYSYFSVDMSPSATGPSSAPPPSGAGAMPNVRVRAEIYEYGRTRDDSGATLIAEGLSDFATLVARPGTPSVYEFRTVVTPLDGSEAFELGPEPFEIRFEIQQFSTEESPELHAAQGQWRLHTGPNFPPRAVFSVANPLMPTALTTTYDSTVYARYSILSPFGSYDIEEENVRVALVGPDGSPPADEDAIELVDMLRSLDHDGVVKPVNFTWRIDHKRLPSNAADHHIEVWVTNSQGTYTVHDTVTLPVAAFDGDASIPGPGPFVLLALLGLVVLIRRRAANR